MAAPAVPKGPAITAPPPRPAFLPPNAPLAPQVWGGVRRSNWDWWKGGEKNPPFLGGGTVSVLKVSVDTFPARFQSEMALKNDGVSRESWKTQDLKIS